MESMASDWSSTPDSDSSSDNDDEVEEQETQSTIEPLSPDFRGRGDRSKGEGGKEEGDNDDDDVGEEKGAKAGSTRRSALEAGEEGEDTPRNSRGIGAPYYRKSGSHQSKNDSSEHLLGAKSSLENSPADSPLKKNETGERESQFLLLSFFAYFCPASPSYLTCLVSPFHHSWFALFHLISTSHFVSLTRKVE